MGQYATNLLTALPKAMPGAKHIVAVPEPVDVTIPGMTIRVIRPSWQSIQHGVALNHWESHDVPRVADGLGANIYHMPHPTPPVEGTFTSVMAVHDMIPWQFSQYRKGLRSKVKLKRILSGIQSADKITTVSKSAAADIATVAHIPKNRISVTYDGVGPEYRKRPSSRVIAAAKKKYQLRRPYVMYIGGFDYRKNVRRLIQAFAESGLGDSHDLVITGSVTPPTSSLHDDFNRLDHHLKKAGTVKQTKLPGFIPEADKPALLAGADAFVYPSLAEGFGLPILEALGVGTSVAASDIPPTKELFGRAVNLFNPENVTEIAKTIRQTVQHPSAVKKRQGQKLAKHYSWDATAKRTAAVFRQLGKK
ncbi:glycosyltransferase family 1 protein [Patescibacteria group bacterium]|nr:glycosyltransferase family 1 protein [Patescibacteria group bacterium]